MNPNTPTPVANARRLIVEALSELGVVDDGYLAPVANAVELLQQAKQELGHPTKVA